MIDAWLVLQCQRLRDACAYEGERSEAQSLRTRVFVNQDKGFAFSSITEEDAATQAIAEVLDWLVTHLHRFRVAAATSDTDPWCVSVTLFLAR